VDGGLVLHLARVVDGKGLAQSRARVGGGLEPKVNRDGA